MQGILSNPVTGHKSLSIFIIPSYIEYPEKPSDRSQVTVNLYYT